MYTLLSLAKARLYYLLRHYLSQRNRDLLKKLLASSRKRWRRVLLLCYGTFTAKELVSDLRRRVKGNFDILMVHSAFDRLLPMYAGSPKELIDELLEFCGEGRTLVMPAFVLGGRSYDAKAYYWHHPFDVKRTASEMGLLTEVFRRMAGVKRSLHPTHSICAVGPLADLLTASHHLAPTRTGKGTPFEVMTHKRTVIVGVGVEYYRCLTHTHTAEDMLGDQFPVEFIKDSFPVHVIADDGREMIYRHTTLKCRRTLDNTLLRSLLSNEELVEWRFHNAAMFITFAGQVTITLIDAARKGITVYGTIRDC